MKTVTGIQLIKDYSKETSNTYIKVFVDELKKNKNIVKEFMNYRTYPIMLTTKCELLFPCDKFLELKNNKEYLGIHTLNEDTLDQFSDFIYMLQKSGYKEDYVFIEEHYLMRLFGKEYTQGLLNYDISLIKNK